MLTFFDCLVGSVLLIATISTFLTIEIKQIETLNRVTLNETIQEQSNCEPILHEKIIKCFNDRAVWYVVS